MIYTFKIKLPLKEALHLITSTCLFLTLVGCQSADKAADKKDQVAEKVVLQICPETRPQMCTMEYLPVCGSKMDASTKTYSNACGACGDKEVTGYLIGACDAQ